MGTLYQYFPNKSALLRAPLQRHISEVGAVIQDVCREQSGASLERMATALVTSFLAAKMKDARASVALYSVSSDVDGARISREMNLRANRAIVAKFATAKDELSTDSQLVASMVQAAMEGVSRRLLESPSPERDYATLSNELVFLVCTYLPHR